MVFALSLFCLNAYQQEKKSHINKVENCFRIIRTMGRIFMISSLIASKKWEM